MSKLNRLTAARDELNRQILAETAGELALQVVTYAHESLNHVGRPDVRIDRVAVQVDSEDHRQSAYPFAWVRIGTSSDDTADTRNVIDDVAGEMQEHFLEWEEYHDWMDALLAIEDREDLAGRLYDLSDNLPSEQPPPSVQDDDRLDDSLSTIATHLGTTAAHIVGLTWVTVGPGGQPVHLQVDHWEAGEPTATNYLYVDQVSTQVRDDIGALVDLLWPAGTDPDLYGEDGRTIWTWSRPPRGADGALPGMLTDAEATKLQWAYPDVHVADEHGNIRSISGTIGNPGCDGCGTADAAARVGGSYMCAAEVRERLEHIDPCVDCRAPQGHGPDGRCDRCENDRHCDECAAVEPADGFANAPGDWHSTTCSLHMPDESVCIHCGLHIVHGVPHPDMEPDGTPDWYHVEHGGITCGSSSPDDVATPTTADHCPACGVRIPDGYPAGLPGPHHTRDCDSYGPAPDLTAGSFAHCEPDGSINERYVDLDEALAVLGTLDRVSWIPEPDTATADRTPDVPDLSGLSKPLRKAAIDAVRKLTGLQPAAAANVVDGKQAPPAHADEVATVLRSFADGRATDAAVAILLGTLVDVDVTFCGGTVTWTFEADEDAWSSVATLDGAAAVVTGLPDRCPDPWRVARTLARIELT